MNVSCPKCGKQLKLSDKFLENIKQLKPDQKARVRCIACEEPFAIDAAVMAKGPAVVAGPRQGAAPKLRRSLVKPPDPPDVSWLHEGLFAEQEVVEEIPLALVLVPEQGGRAEVIKAVEALGYRAEVAASGESAIEKMEFVNYSGVILHDEFEQGGLARGAFHGFMSAMGMAKRRYIFYVLIGKSFHTLYDLEALANSANIVVNERDVQHFGTILRKTIPEYEALFGPLMEELRVLGR